MKIFWWLTSIVFLLAFGLSISDWSIANNAEEIIQLRIEKRLEEHQQALQIGDGYIFGDSKGLEEISVLVYQGRRLINWNSFQYAPDLSSDSGSESPIVYVDGGGTYLISSRIEGDYRFYAISTLTKDQSIENEYVSDFTNPRIFSPFNAKVVTGGSKTISLNGQELFRYDIVQDEFIGPGAITLWWVFLYLLTLTLYIRNRKRPSSQISIFIWLLPLAILAWWLPTSHSNIRLFYLSVLSIVFLYHLFSVFSRKIFRSILLISRTYGHLFQVLWLLVFFNFNLGFLYGLKSVLDYFGWQIDISVSLSLDWDVVLAYCLLILAGFVALAVNHLLLRLISKIVLRPFFWVVGGVIIVSLSFVQSSALFIYAVTSSAIVLGVVSYFKLNQLKWLFSYKTFFYLLLGFGFVAFMNATSLYKYAEDKQRQEKRLFGQQVLNPEDELLQQELKQISLDIKSDPNIRVRLLNPLLPRGPIQNRVRQEHLRSFLEEYEIEILLFDDRGLSFGRYPSYLQDILAGYGLANSNEGVYYLENLEGYQRQRYVITVDLTYSQERVGSLLITMVKKKISPRSVYPALLSTEQVDTKEFDFLLFKKGELVFSRGDYSFDFFSKPKKWEKLKNTKDGIETDGYNLVVHSDGDDFVVVISNVYPIRSMLANFSFHVILFLIVLGLYFSVSRAIGSGVKLTLSNRIQLYLGVSFLFPLLVVSAVILNLLNVSYKEEIIRNYEKRCLAVSENMYATLREYQDNEINISTLNQTLGNASDLVRADINLYSARGVLLVSSQPSIYENKLISRLINPAVLSLVDERPEQVSVFEERIASLDYRAVYRGVVDHRTGELLGIMSIPFFESKNHLNRQQLEVFGNLVMVFTTIFIVSTFLGYFVIRNITFPITLLSRRLRTTNLEAENEPIVYQGDDEIGLLVKEYNGMLSKLEASKEALAISQKETAWKEIARQVAHEIKNPLTPMKLKIQQVLRQMDNDDDKRSMLNSLLNQIDSLSDIADSFSAFAKMPAPKLDVVDVSKLAVEVCDLYQSQNVTIKLDCKPGLLVMADAKILNRVFNNLLLNGIQASEEKGQAQIEVTLFSEDKKVKAVVTDHGEGIPEEISHKVFTPYFSTKEKGSGIGLAIAKKGIEQAGGSIWFESKKGEGTTFTMLLPKVSD